MWERHGKRWKYILYYICEMYFSSPVPWWLPSPRHPSCLPCFPATYFLYCCHGDGTTWTNCDGQNCVSKMYLMFHYVFTPPKCFLYQNTHFIDILAPVSCYGCLVIYIYYVEVLTVLCDCCLVIYLVPFLFASLFAEPQLKYIMFKRAGIFEKTSQWSAYVTFGVLT